MAGRQQYTDADKARVFAVLTANQENVKRTARETGVPENTVRRWRDEWRANGPPETEQVEEAVEEFTQHATRVRQKALTLIEDKIDAGDAKIGELNAVVGTLTDKMHVLQGLATSRTEHVHALPTPEQARELIAPFVQAALHAAALREEEIVDVEAEQISLPAGD